MIQPTIYPHVNELLGGLLAQMQKILDGRFVGLYLYGSLVTGDYDSEISDVDLLAATSGDINTPEFGALKKMHDSIVLNHPEWDNRLEVAYLSLEGLKIFRTQTSQIAVISPGEPFHLKEAGIEWLMNWYVVREKGVTLFGPPPEAILDPISKEEFIQTVKVHMSGWREWINEVRTRPSQAYAILTMCRGLYTFTNGEQVSKIQAVLWTERALPEWAFLIKNAVLWRQAWREKDIDHEATLPETRRFVHFVIDRILG